MTAKTRLPDFFVKNYWEQKGSDLIATVNYHSK